MHSNQNPNSIPQTSGELTDDQLDQVNGGIFHILLAALGVKETFYDSMSEINDALGGKTTSSNVVAGPNGEGCTEYGLPTGLGR